MPRFWSMALPHGNKMVLIPSLKQTTGCLGRSWLEIPVPGSGAAWDCRLGPLETTGHPAPTTLQMGSPRPVSRTSMIFHPQGTRGTEHHTDWTQNPGFAAYWRRCF